MEKIAAYTKSKSRRESDDEEYLDEDVLQRKEKRSFRLRGLKVRHISMLLRL
jgi:hypothetical protein